METTKIADKDKLYIVYYLCVAEYDNAHAYDYMWNLRHKMEDMFDDTVNIIVVPVRDGDSRVEMFNLDKSTPDENLEKLNRAAAALNEFILQNLKK